MPKKRIGIVAPQLGIPSEIWMRRQYESFARLEPVLLTWETSPGFETDLELHRFGVPLGARDIGQKVLRRLGFAAGEMPGAAARRDIRDTVAAANVDGLLCHFAWSGLAVSNALPAGKPVVWHVHGRDVSASLEGAAYRAALRRTLPSISHLVAVGRFQIDRLKRLGLGDNFSLIPCGAPTDLFAQGPIPRRAAGAPIRYLCVSRISEEKGVLQTLAAFEMASRGREDMELVYIGDGPQVAALRLAAAASPHAARIRLAGTLPSQGVAREMGDAHVFLQHSLVVSGWVEGFGVSLTEAGAAGLPLVASSTGGIVDQVEHAHNGFLFPPGAIEAQARHMLQLADDEKLRRGMGANARAVASRFDSQLMTTKLEDVLLAAIELGQPSC